MKRICRTCARKQGLSLSVNIVLFCFVMTAAAPVRLLERDAKVNVAVIDLRPTSGVSASESEVLSDRLRAEIFNTGKVNVMEREQMREILKENALQQSGACSEEQCILEMGKFLGVQLLVMGTIGRLGKLNILNIRLVDVKTARTEMAVSKDIDGDIERVVGYLRTIALELVEPIAKPKPAPAILGKIMVETKPPGATIRLNGRVIGNAPLTVDSLAPGTYLVSAEKEMHFASQTSVIIEKIETKNVVFDLPLGALLTVNSAQAGAMLWVNDSTIGKTPVQPLLLRGDSTVVRVTLEGYNEYREVVRLAPGLSKILTVNMESKYGTLDLTSEPKGAAMQVNGLSTVYTTPCAVRSLEPGVYSIMGALLGYDPVTDTVTMVKGRVVKKTYRFVHTKAWNDSAAAAKATRDVRRKRNKRVCQYVFGALSLISAGTGIFAETQVKSAYAGYSAVQTTDPAAHDSKWQAVEQWRNVRTISYSCAGLFAVGFGITFVF
jgi:TolB-like protein